MKIEEPARTEFVTLDEKTTKLVCLGDPHGAHEKLKLAIEREDSPSTQFVSNGDNIGYRDGLDSALTARILMDWNIPSVLGNHSQGLDPETRRLFLVDCDNARSMTLDVETAKWALSLPFRIIFETPRLPGRRIYVQHSLYQSMYGWTGVDRWMIADDVDMTTLFAWKPEFVQTKLAYDRLREKWTDMDKEFYEAIKLSSNPAERFVFPEPADILVLGHSHRPGAIETTRAGAGRPGAWKRELYDVSMGEDWSFHLDPENKLHILDAGSVGRPQFPSPRAKSGWAGYHSRGTYVVIDFSAAPPTATFRFVEDPTQQQALTDRIRAHLSKNPLHGD